MENKQEARRQAAKYWVYQAGVSYWRFQSIADVETEAQFYEYEEEVVDAATADFMARRDGQSHGHDSKIPAEQTRVCFSLSYQDRGTSRSDLQE